MEVSVGVIPGAITPLALETGSTVAVALDLAGLTAAGYEIRVNNVVASESTVLNDGDRVLLAKAIVGNQ